MNNDEDENLIYKPISMEIVNKINNSINNKIILTGIDKSGKTTTLKCLMNSNNDFIIYLDYSNLNYEAKLSELEYQYYYELILVMKIVNYIRINYNDYYKNMMIYDKYIQTKFNRFINYLQVKIYSSNEIRGYQKGMFISKINEILRQIIKVNTITLIIDHFDFVGNSSKRFQTFMIDYFKMFDKTIITSNDTNLNYEKLQEKGYEIIEVDYSKNIDNIKKILTLHFNNWFNQINNNKLDISVVTKVNYLINNDKFCYNLIKKTNGNIEIMINILKDYFIKNCSIDTAIASIINAEMELNNITFRKKLHI